jgi:hypothetical protein
VIDELWIKMIIIEHIHPWSWQFSLITEEAKKIWERENRRRD